MAHFTGGERHPGRAKNGTGKTGAYLLEKTDTQQKHVQGGGGGGGELASFLKIQH